MKKITTLIIIAITLLGCELSNTPTSKVEELMAKYQMLDSDIKDEIELVLSDDELTIDQKNQYKELIENQYKNMSYEIKEETIDGDNAIVTVAIEVIDYKKIIDKIDSEYTNIENYTIEDYNNKKLKQLKNAKDKITYTLDINVTKTSEGEWRVDTLGNTEKKKIQGMY